MTIGHPDHPVYGLSNGRFLGAPHASLAAVAGGAIGELPIIVVDDAGNVRDTLALRRLDGVGEAVITAGVRSDGRSYHGHPLPAADMIGFAPDGSGAVIVDRKSWTGPDPAEYGVARIDAEGDTLFRRRIAYEARPVPGGFDDREIELSLEGSSRAVRDRDRVLGRRTGRARHPLPGALRHRALTIPPRDPGPALPRSCADLVDRRPPSPVV